MKILLNDRPGQVTPQELQRDLRLLPAWRREKVLSYHFLIDRVLSAKAYLLLVAALAEAYGIDDRPDFDYVGMGKPVLAAHPQVHFNISHCRRGVMCAVDDREVGCDIEEIPGELDLELCRHCFNEAEVADILSADCPRVRFTRWWTRKEAYLKLLGRGVDDHLPSLFSAGMRPVDFLTEVNLRRGYVYTLCQFKTG